MIGSMGSDEWLGRLGQPIKSMVAGIFPQVFL